MKSAKKILLVQLSLLAFVLGCNQSMDIFDPNTGNDWGTLNPDAKSDGVLKKKINVSARDEETVRFRAPRLLTLTMTQPEDHWGNQPDLEMKVTMENSTFSSGRAITPKLTLTAGKADTMENALVEYVLTIKNHGTDMVWGELIIDGRPKLGPCQDVKGHWDTDSIQFVASCTKLVDGHVDGHGASFKVHEATACLAKGIWGMNKHSYWTLKGHIDAKSVDFDYTHSAGYFATAFEDSGDGNRIEVSDESIDFEVLTKADGVINGDDLKTSATFDRKKKTLDFVQQAKEWGAFSEWETSFATRWECKAL